ncbi:MAG: histidine kinase [Bacteroidota bacterium]
MKKQIWFDLKAWLAVLLLLPLGVQANSHLEQLMVSLGIWVILLLGFYPHRWLIRRYVDTKKWVQYFVGLSFLLIGLVLFSKFMLGFVKGMENADYWQLAQNMAVILFFSTAVSYAYKGIWLQIQYEKARRQQVEAELKLLQSQVNPHFLFNTLNNIYAQNLSNHEDANDMILQLADLMRYQTESSRKARVLLSEEISFLHNYIALEKKRLTANTEVLFQVEVPEDTRFLLPPMIFVPFVENAFKHGIGTGSGNFIHIYLSVQGEDLTFILKNSLPQQKKTVLSTRMGLENVKKRLELLFPGQYQLQIDASANIYYTRLTLADKGGYLL